VTINKPNSKIKRSDTKGKPVGWLEKAYGGSPVAVMVIDAGHRVYYANPVALSTFAEHEIIGWPVFDLYEDTSPGKINEGKLARFEEIADGEFKAKTGSGERWFSISAVADHESGGLPQITLFIRDITAFKKKENLFSYLNEAAASLAKTRDTPGALELVARLVVPRFATWFTIDRLTESGLELLMLKHEDPARIAWAYQYRKKYPPDLNGNSGPAVVLKTGKPGFVSVVTEEMINAVVTDPAQRRDVLKIGLHSVIITPMWADEKIIGLVNFISSVPGRHFDAEDVAFAQNFANLIGLALENARLNEESANEIALRKNSEEKLQFLTDAIPHKLWTSGPDGRATYYNQRWYEYTGVYGFETLRDKIWDSLHPDDRSLAAVEWPEVIKLGNPAEIEQRLMRHDGVYRWHLSRIMPHKNNDGDVTLWIGTSTDIHEQKVFGMELAAVNEELTAANEEFVAMNEELVAMNEEVAATNEELASANQEQAITNAELMETRDRLRKSEKLFRSIALSIPKSLVTVIDKDHRYVMIEGDIMEKMGYDRRDYEGKHPADISPEQYQTDRGLYERVLKGEAFSVERRAPAGEYYLVHFVPLPGDRSEVDSALIIAFDVSDIKQSEEKIAKLAAIVESSEDAIVSKTPEGVVTSWNAAAERMFGFTESEMIGQTIYAIIPPDRHDEEPRILARLRRGEHVEHFETKRMTKSGQLIDVSLTISPIMDKQGNIIGLSKIARDISAKKQEEQRKNDFIGMVSHELKTPLTSLNGIIQIAAAKLNKNEDAFLAEAMDRAKRQLKRMTAMVNGFLDVSRFEAGTMSITYQEFDLAELLNEIVGETKMVTSTHPVNFLGSGRVHIYADLDKISSVVFNLLNNAVKYSTKGKNIDVAYQVTKKEVLVSVKDEGIGIEARDIEKIFERYYRVDDPYSRRVSGFGIGLYLSAEIIRRHNGKIWAESEPGKGSTFYFTLPLIKGI
jgi:PAS domain S-box-containing protein